MEPPTTPGSDDTLFVAAVAGGRRVADRPPVPRTPAVPLPPLRDPDAEARAHVERLLAGEVPLDVLDTDEAVQSAPDSVDPVLLQRLARGEFSVQRFVDLHGLVVEEAREELRVFLVESVRRSLRCVLVVHGRGRHSKDGEAVLKGRVVGWLSRGGLSRHVLAFCTARPHDGGAGALYVLLRPPGRRRARSRRRGGTNAPDPRPRPEDVP